MKKKVDFKTNNFVAETLVEIYPWMIAASASSEENYDIDDVVFTARTPSDLIKEGKMEVKTIKKCLKSGKNWNKWYDLSNDKGIMSKIYCLPPCATTADTCYILNAEDYYGNLCNSKWSKMIKEEAYLTYLAKDGLLIFTPEQLKEAFLGVAYYLNASHGTNLNPYHDKFSPHYELKALINLNKGKWIPWDVPPEIID